MLLITINLKFPIIKYILYICTILSFKLIPITSHNKTNCNNNKESEYK